MLNASRQIGTALGVAVLASLFVAGRAPVHAVQLAMLGGDVLYVAAAVVVALGRPATRAERAATPTGLLKGTAECVLLQARSRVAS